MTDYQLLVKIKTENSLEAANTLWERYLPQTMKHVHRVFEKFHHRTSVSEEDFIQDLWLRFHNRLQWIEFEKIDDTKNWRYSNLHWFDIKKLDNIYTKLLYEDGGTKSLQQSFEEEDSDYDESYFKITENYEVVSRYSIEAMNFDHWGLLEKEEAILNSFSPFQKKIIDLKKSGLNFRQISEKLSVKYTQVLSAYHSAKEQAEMLLFA